MVSITKENRELIIKLAKLFLDTPYEFGGNGCLPGEATDCSNYTQNILGRVGITVERTSFQQGDEFKKKGFFYEDLKRAEVGDLIFFKKTYESENEITHVGIYMGDNVMIHAGNPKICISNIAGYWKSHFKGVGAINAYASSFNKKLAMNNYEKLGGKDDIIIPDSYDQVETLKAVNAVIAVLTSTWADLPENFQEESASYAKSLRETYPKARKLEKDQAKKVYQSLADFLSYAYKYAGEEEKQKYAELAQYLRNKFKLQN